MILKSVSNVVFIVTVFPPHSAMTSGYVVQYGAGSRNSSPSFIIAANAWNTACLPPFVTRMLFGLISYPLSRLVLSAIAWRNAGSPFVGEYRWFVGFWAACIAVSTMYCGVGKSGSPAPNPITGCPAAFSSFALASTASVALGVIDVNFLDSLVCVILFPNFCVCFC